VLVPSLATLTAASVLAVAALVASVVTGTPSAQARVAAAGRTATDGYRVRIVSTTSDKKLASSPATQTSQGSSTRRSGPAGCCSRVRGWRSASWVTWSTPSCPQRPGPTASAGWLTSAASTLIWPVRVRELTKLAWQDPQQALTRLRSAAAVHEQGRVYGDGWRGRRYAFELTDNKRGMRVTGTVDVDQAGRVRRLELMDRLTTSPGRAAGMLRTVMEFRD
jgi:hypothetical protein